MSALLGPDLLKGLSGLLVGVTIGLIGIDTQTGQPRLVFGVNSLLDGIDVVIVVVALFALSESFGPADPSRSRPPCCRGRTSAAPGRPGCAAPRSGSRSAASPRRAEVPPS